MATVDTSKQMGVPILSQLGPSALMGGLGFLSNMAARDSQQEANKANERINERNLQWAKQQYFDSKAWNSAPNQVALLRAAGMNPAFMFGGAQAGHAQAVIPPSSIPMQPLPQLDMNGIANVAKGIELNSAERDKTKAETDFAKVQTKQAEFELFLDNTFKFSERNEKLNLTVAECKKAYNQALLFQAEGDVAKADEQLKKAQEMFYYAAGSLNHYNALIAEKDFLNYSEFFQMKKNESTARVDFLKKSASNQAAQAYYASQQGSTVSALRGSQVRLAKYQADWQMYDTMKKRQSWWAEGDKIVQDLRNAGLLSQHMQEQINKLAQENNWYEIQQIMSMIDTMSGAYSSAGHVQNGSRAVDASEVRNAIDKEYNDFKMSGVDSYQSWKLDKKGNKVFTSGTDHLRRK